MLFVLLEAWSMLLAAASTIAPRFHPVSATRRYERQQSTTYEMDAFRCVGQSTEQLAAPPRRRNPHALPPPYGVSTCVDGARYPHVCDALPPARQTHMHQDPPTSAVPFQPRPCASNSSPLPLLACCACTARAPSVDLTSHRVRSHARGHRSTETPPSPALCAPTSPSMWDITAPRCLLSQPCACWARILQRQEVRVAIPSAAAVTGQSFQRASCSIPLCARLGCRAAPPSKRVTGSLLDP